MVKTRDIFGKNIQALHILELHSPLTCQFLFKKSKRKVQGVPQSQTLRLLDTRVVFYEISKIPLSTQTENVIQIQSALCEILLIKGCQKMKMFS